MRRSSTTAAPGPSRRRRWSGIVPMAVGVLLVASAGVWQGYAWLWGHHVDEVGHALVARHQHRLASGADGSLLAACGGSGSSNPSTATSGGGTTGAAGSGGSGAGASGDPVAGLLSIPSLHMLAPVEQGDDDATLAVAVGHIPTSVWPGATGTAILAAHDVSYFVDIDQLADGATVEYQAPCTTYEFVVSSHQVVQAGSPLYNSPDPTLVLETCWPTDALWYTPDRLLVTATEVATTPTDRGSAQAGSQATTVADADAQPPTVDAPAALVAQGLTLTTNSIPMGTLTEPDDPPAAWAQSPAPLAVQSSALEAFIGDLKAAEQGNGSWWEDLSPGVPMPGALRSATISDWHQGLDSAVTTQGDTPTGAELSATVTVSGGSAPGLYDLQVDETVANGTLSVHSWSLTPDAA